MLSENEKNIIIDLVNDSLDEAEHKWENGGSKIATESFKTTDFTLARNNAETVPSSIPGHPLVNDRDIVIDEFVVLVADMRESSNHLLQAISRKTATVSQLQRVYYETSALLPALAQTVQFEGGETTEYLGDGILSMFKVDENEREKALYAANRASNDIIVETRYIINAALNKRYGLPQIDIGIGLAFSKSLVTLVGLDGNKHPKIFGESVYRATKLSYGTNEVIVDEYMYKMWPTQKNGTLHFRQIHKNNVKGYIIQHN